MMCFWKADISSHNHACLSSWEIYPNSSHWIFVCIFVILCDPVTSTLDVWRSFAFSVQGPVWQRRVHAGELEVRLRGSVRRRQRRKALHHSQPENQVQRWADLPPLQNSGLTRSFINSTVAVAVPGWAIFVTILVTVLVVVLAIFLLPRLYRRLRFRNYSHLQDLTSPVPT